MKTIDRIANRPWVAHIDDERNLGNSIIVTLDEDYVFADERNCGVRGFDTIKEANEGTLSRCVISKRDALREKVVGKCIVHAGHVWKVQGVGAQRNGSTICHLAHTSKGRQQKNGWVPVQIEDWVDTAVLVAAK